MDMEKLVSLCKRRGFIFPSSEIYGGLNGFWDYGPLGVELKRNIKDAWWRDNITLRDDMVGLDCSIIMNPKVWEASGHVGGFSDPMADCKKCNGRFRADQLLYIRIDATTDDGQPSRTPVYFFGLGGVTEVYEQNAKRIDKLKGSAKPGETIHQTEGVFAGADRATQELFECPTCKTVGSLTEPRNFNLMFESHAGALATEANKVYLRPETAQGIFANFKNVVDTARVRIPFGIGQVGKSFRNEINPRNFTFRSREFEQMEIEFFCHPDTAAEWYAYWRKTRFQWYVDHGLQSDRLRLRDHDPDELAFYSTATADIEYEFPFGVSELEGIAHRGAYDLGQHQKFSGKDLTYFDEEMKERYLPHVIEPSAGADRATLAFLCEAYKEDQVAGETRTVLSFHPRFAPIKAAVFPLVKRDGMPEMAEKIYRDLKRHFNAFLDEKGAIGRRYRRQDEAGTPLGITVDGQSITDGTVTFRDRDTCRQWRVPATGVVEAVRDLLEGGTVPEAS
ncbi:glycine--tRNA ligase [Tundrisphaera sp. TA3]|uniref:glycine--tRNA ligase n=1 Tax=Tundrisphaera sp. TA3 TaxID=3435775 RepID=UPI003EBFEDA1